MNSATRKLISPNTAYCLKTSPANCVEFGVHQFGKSFTTSRESMHLDTARQCPLAEIQNRIKKLKIAIKSIFSTAGNRNLNVSQVSAPNCSFVKSYDSIPKPRTLPLLGSVLDYTPLGKFTPMEFDKALATRHKE